MSNSDQLQHLRTLVDPSEIITPADDDYLQESSTWSIQKHQHPTLIIRPHDITSLSKVIAHLHTTTLDYAVRSLGFGNASAKDVLVSLTAFNNFSFDRENEVVTVGVGQDWESYYHKMHKVAPDYSVIACRTPCIGIGGSTLCGGYTWLSREYGCTSDPSNLLDIRVVKRDGSVIWASEEPNLLWAMRGAGASFGVATELKLRARKYTQNIWAGTILLSTKHVIEIFKGIADMSDRKNTDPKVGLFLYVMRKELLGYSDAEDDMLVMHVFDALGEEHGRSEDAFAWAFRVPGAIDHTKMMNLKDVALMQGAIAKGKGQMSCGWSAMALTDLKEEVQHRAFKWWEDGQKIEDVKEGTYLIFELFCTRDNITGRSQTAWPRPEGIKHVLLIGSGCPPSASIKAQQQAHQRLLDGPKQILGEGEKINFVPNAKEDFHSAEEMFGEHYERLLNIKRQYDPDNRLKGLIQG